VLVFEIERVQAGVGVLVEHFEIREIVLKAVAFKISEDTFAQIVVGEQKAAEIFIEKLRARARRHKIVVGRQVAEVVFAEGFLQGHMSIETCVALAWIDVDREILLHVRVVEIEDRRHANFPFARLEIRFASEELQ